MISVLTRARELAEAAGAKEHPPRGDVRPEHVAQATDEALKQLRAEILGEELLLGPVTEEPALTARPDTLEALEPHR